MTKEELKTKEKIRLQNVAKDWLRKEHREGNIQSLVNLILSFTESKDKRIEELEKENAELKEKKIKGCYFGKDELGNDFFAKCDCVDCQKRSIALLDLRREYLNKINKEKIINDQLTKAKNILRRLMDTQPPHSDMCEEADLVDWREVNKEAEQFLNNEGK